MFPNWKRSTSRVLTATCCLTLAAAGCSSDSTDNDQTASGQTGENNPTTTGTTGGAGGSKTTGTGGRGGSGGASSTSSGSAGRPSTSTSTTNSGASSTAGKAGSTATSTGSGGSGGSTTAASAGVSGSTSAGNAGAAGSGSGAAGANAAAGSGGAAGAAGAAGKGGAGGKGGSGGAGGANAATSGDQSLSGMADPTLVANTGDSCQSYTEPADGKCGGWYCGVDQATLTKAVDSSAVCGGNVELLCSNAVPTAVASCARTAKTGNLAATNDELRPMIRDCVFQDTTIQQGATPECVDCLIDVAACASDNCLTQCLTGDSPGCDSCRKQNNCDQMVFSCGGLPSPI